MKSLGFCLILSVLFFVGCGASGHGKLGDCVTLPDGTQTCATYGKTPGISGPDVTFAKTWRCAEGERCQNDGEYSGSAPGAAEVGVAGMGAATVSAVGAGVAANQLRPSRTNITGVSGNVGSTASAGADVNQSQVQKGIGNSSAQTGPVNNNSSSYSRGGDAKVEKGAVINVNKPVNQNDIGINLNQNQEQNAASPWGRGYHR